VEEGQAIPYELYAAVAGILAFLYRQQVEKAARERSAVEEAAKIRAVAGLAFAGGGGM
jgi:flagellar biosynthesis protein FlhB